MNSDVDPKLRELFARYAPPIEEQPFLAEAHRLLERAERRARVRSAMLYAALLGIGVWVSLVSLATIDAWWSSLEALLVRLTAGLSPMGAQLSIYGGTLAAGLLARRRIRALLAPW